MKYAITILKEHYNKLDLKYQENQFLHSINQYDAMETLNENVRISEKQDKLTKAIKILENEKTTT